MVAATALGAFAGLFVATYMNAVRKLPIFRQPWEHALMMGAGAYGFNQLEAFEKRVRTPPAPLTLHGNRCIGTGRHTFGEDLL
jgi:hypothetical protein